MRFQFVRSLEIPTFIGLALLALNAHAAIGNEGVLDNVLNRYSTAAASWSGIITTHASFLFWLLATVSMVWTMGIMILRRADLGEFYAEFVRFIFFTGFFWWLLSNGPAMAVSVINSLRQIGGEATGTSPALSPSGIVDIGFEIFYKVLDHSSVWSPIDSATGLVISAAILIVMALIGINMLLLLIGAWILAYAGIFFLGFGGSRWTSDMAIGYFKTVLSMAAQLLTMVLLIGIGRSFIDQYYLAMSAGLSLKELAVMLVVAVCMLLLVRTLPPMMGQLAFGGTSGSIGNFGAGAAMGAAAMGAAAVASAGAAIASTVAAAAGGGSAVMAAVQKASQNVAGGTDLLSNLGGGAGSGGSDGNASGGGSGGGGGGGTAGQSPLASAMGDSGTGSSGGGQQQASAGGSAGPAGGFSASSAPQAAPTAGDGAGGGGTRSTPAGSNSTAGGGTQAKDPATAARGGGAPGEVKSGGMSAALLTAGKIAADATANLAQGIWSATKDAANERLDAASERIADTTGGKIAAAIRGHGAEPSAGDSGTASPSSSAPAHTSGGGLAATLRAAANRMSDADGGAGAVSEFGNNSLGRRPDKADLTAEVAAFRDRDSKSA